MRLVEFDRQGEGLSSLWINAEKVHGLFFDKERNAVLIYTDQKSEDEWMVRGYTVEEVVAKLQRAR